jgi:hypothetical protein
MQRDGVPVGVLLNANPKLCAGTSLVWIGRHGGAGSMPLSVGDDQQAQSKAQLWPHLLVREPLSSMMAVKAGGGVGSLRQQKSYE